MDLLMASKRVRVGRARAGVAARSAAEASSRARADGTTRL